MIRGGLRGVKEWVGRWNMHYQALQYGQERSGDTQFMTMRLTYPDGLVEIVPEAEQILESQFVISSGSGASIACSVRSKMFIERWSI